MVAVEGETVSILCSTQSNPDPILTIFKEKQILATVIYESELQLELPAVTPEDDGEYWCVAENQFGQRATAFNLSVECEYPPPAAHSPLGHGNSPVHADPCGFLVSPQPETDGPVCEKVRGALWVGRVLDPAATGRVH